MKSAVTTIIAALGIFLVPEARPRADEQRAPRCPDGMIAIDAASCIDPFEAFVEELDEAGAVVRAHSPYEPISGKHVRARSERGAIPQAYVSQREASDACVASHKRLCTDKEWQTACAGSPVTRYPYGERHRAGYCNDAGTEALPVVFPGKGVDLFRLDRMNDPRLDQVPGSLARSGAFTRCRSERGVFDMVGNLHEWTEDPAGTMRGGFYLDTSSMGEGCGYAAVGHDTLYHDYSTGFRCCADALPD